MERFLVLSIYDQRLNKKTLCFDREIRKRTCNYVISSYNDLDPPQLLAKYSLRMRVCVCCVCLRVQVSRFVVTDYRYYYNYYYNYYIIIISYYNYYYYYYYYCENDTCQKIFCNTDG